MGCDLESDEKGALGLRRVLVGVTLEESDVGLVAFRDLADDGVVIWIVLGYLLNEPVLNYLICFCRCAALEEVPNRWEKAVDALSIGLDDPVGVEQRLEVICPDIQGF